MKKLKVRESILHFYQYFMFIVKTILWLIILSFFFFFENPASKGLYFIARTSETYTL